MIRVLIAALCFPGFASANVWDEFQNRCLTPMEAAEPLDLEDFRVSGKDPSPLLYVLEEGDLVVFVTTRETTWIGYACLVESTDPALHAELRMEFENWRSTVLAEGRYAYSETAYPHWSTLTDPKDLDRRDLYSVEFREPRLRIGLMDIEGQLGVIAEDTDLES